MAGNDTAALVVAMSAQLTKFEKQMKEAGVIADREVKSIEDRFARANPQFSGSFLGSFLGNVASQGFTALVRTVEDLVARFIELERVAKLVNVEMNELFGLQEAGRKVGVPVGDVTQSMKQLAILLDQMKRGEDNTLAKLLDANPQALQGVNREALTLQQTFAIVADLVQNARTEIQKIDLARLAGQAETMVPLLERGGTAIGRMQKAAAESAPDLQKLANEAKEFDRLWKQAIDNLKAHLVGLVEPFKLKLVELSELAISLLSTFTKGVFVGGLLEGPSRQAIEAWKEFGDNVRASIAAAQTASGPVTRQQRSSGDLPGGGTATRAFDRPLSTVPPRDREPVADERDRFQRATENLERRIEGMKAEAAAADLGTAARERAKISAELETIAKQVNGEVTAEQRRLIDQLAAAYGRAAGAIEQARSPLATFARESADLNRQLNNFAAQSLDNLTNSMADVVTGTKNIKDAFRDMATSIARDLARIAIRQAITGPLAKALLGGIGGIPGLAGGTDSWGGGLAMVGERGPELINLPRGAQVIPNDIARNARAMAAPVITIMQNVDATGADAAAIARLTAGLAAVAASTRQQALDAVHEFNRRRA